MPSKQRIRLTIAIAQNNILTLLNGIGVLLLNIMIFSSAIAVLLSTIAIAQNNILTLLDAIGVLLNAIAMFLTNVIAFIIKT